MSASPDSSSVRQPPYRVFVSYSHEDEELFARLDQKLRALNLRVLSDKRISAGAPFTAEIKNMITCSHLFLPLITERAQLRPWVHQETGFAMARNVPILPVVVVGAHPDRQMIAQLQAVPVDDSFAQLDSHLTPGALQALIDRPPDELLDSVSIADLPEERTRMLAANAERVFDHMRRDHHGGPVGDTVRQRTLFSSFSVPDLDATDELWDQRDGKGSFSEYYKGLLRRERQVLEAHAQVAGCRLIVCPAFAEAHGTGADNRLRDSERLVRIEVLTEFVERMPDHLCDIVLSSKAAEGHLVIVGDWFVAESMSPRPTGFRHTTFHWHAPTTARWVRRFDRQFEDICKSAGLTPGRTREPALAKLKALAAELRHRIATQAPS